MEEKSIMISVSRGTHHFQIDETIEFFLKFSKDVAEFNFIRFEIAKIAKDLMYNTVVCQLTTALEFDRNKERCVIRLNANILKDGIFFFSATELLKQDSWDSPFPLKVDTYGTEHIKQYYFKIITDNPTNGSINTIQIEIDEIMAFRKSDFLKGVGNFNAKSFYSVYFFTKNVYLDKRFTYGQLEIIPFRKISSSDIYNFINAFISEEIVGGVKIGYDPNLRIKYENPGSIVFMPKVFAHNVEEAHSIGENIVNNLLKSFSLTRNTSGEIISSLIIDPEGCILYYNKPQPFVAKNIVHGEDHGENPFLNQEILGLINIDRVFSLCIDLYKDATNESEIEIKYSKFWTILEVLSESKGYPSKILKKTYLNGEKISSPGNKNQNNKPTIKDKVRELIRENLNQNNFLINLLNPSSLKLKRIDDLITIWYRHRNCMVHAGGCQPENPLVCKSSPDYSLCKSKHTEVVQHNKVRSIHNDAYLGRLEQTTRCILLNYFQSKTGSKNFNELIFLQVSQVPTVKFERIALSSLGKLKQTLSM